MMTEREALALGTEHRVSSWKAFVYVLQFLKPQLPRLLLVCLIDIAIVLLNLSIPWLGKQVVDQVLPQRDWGGFWAIAFSVAMLLMLVHALTGTRTFLYNATEQLLQHVIRRKMYTHLQKLSMETIDSLPIGQHQFRISTDADRIAHMLVRILPTLTMLVEFAIILTTAIYVDPVLTGVVALFLIPWTILFVWVTHYGRILDRRRLQLCEIRDAGILQAANSFFTIKSLGRSRDEVWRNGRISTALQRVANQGYLILVFFEFATQKAIPWTKNTTIFLYLARQVVQGQMTLGMTVPMIAYLSRLSFPIERIVNFGCWIWQTMVSAERMMFIMETEPSIVDPVDPKECPPVSGHVQFHAVSFDRPRIGRVLDSIELELKPKTVTAIVGPSGSGKSTLVELALRILDPVEGQVTIDGNDLRSLRLDSYLHQVGTVMQDTYLFSGSLKDNLKIANPDASDAEIQDAIEKAELTNFVATLPEGILQDLDGGSALSAGQKQRIGIARAMIVNPKLLILDEATSALDAETERDVMATLSKISKNVTTLMVTHRLDTALDADRIIVLGQGRIVEEGNHESLMQVNGAYAKMRAVYKGGHMAEMT
ncbi:MAG: ABC transporter ATP-binding protein [Chthonomonas sp.]|nr:ABC transporter ATP-binding protein [Chthonomonas sp.]